MYYNVTMRRVRTPIGAVGNNMCVCVSVALGIQHAMRMRHTVICPAVQYFAHIIS